MASTFKNAGITVPVVDTSAGDLFTAGASATAVIHALYISNKSTTASATVDVKVTTDGGEDMLPKCNRFPDLKSESEVCHNMPCNNDCFAGGVY